MKITNKNNLPGSLITAALLDDYDKGDADISVTGLIGSPRIPLMYELYGDVVTQDVSAMLWPMLGTAFHKMMEEGDEPDAIKERRLYATRKGWTVSGQIDRTDSEGTVIRDYKVTSAFTIMREREEWHRQLNVYGWLHYENFGNWPDLEIIALARDWRVNEALSMGDYPSEPIKKITIPEWEPEEVLRYVDERIDVHQSARAAYDQDGTVAECSAEDRWARPDRWAVVKPGAKRALRVFDERKHAEAYCGKIGLRTKVEKRDGQQVRCEQYCIFSKHCLQWHDIDGEVKTRKFAEWMDDDRT